MTKKRRRYGVRDIQSLMDRCYVDADTNCWHWRLHKNEDGLPMVVIVTAEGLRRQMSGRRVAMLLRGHDMKGKRAWPKARCLSYDCVNPDHCAVGTTSEFHAYMASTDRLKGNQSRITKLRKFARARSKVRPEMIERIRSYDGKAKVIAEELGISKTTVNDIRSGRRWNDLSGGIFSGLLA